MPPESIGSENGPVLDRPAALDTRDPEPRTTALGNVHQLGPRDGTRSRISDSRDAYTKMGIIFDFISIGLDYSSRVQLSASWGRYYPATARTAGISTPLSCSFYDTNAVTTGSTLR